MKTYLLSLGVMCLSLGSLSASADDQRPHLPPQYEASVSRISDSDLFMVKCYNSPNASVYVDRVATRQEVESGAVCASKEFDTYVCSAEDRIDSPYPGAITRYVLNGRAEGNVRYAVYLYCTGRNPSERRLQACDFTLSCYKSKP